MAALLVSMQEPATGYIIATTPRTGGWLLCDLLRQTKAAGRPGEYGSVQDRATWQGFCGFATHRQYFDSLRALHSTPNGVLGIKLMWPQLVEFGRDARGYFGCEAGDFDLLVRVLGRFSVVRLERRDRLRQAISWLRAERSGTWSLTESGSPVVSAPPVYDGPAITYLMATIRRQSTGWDAALESFGPRVCHVFYEDLVSDYKAVARAVLEFIGVDPTLARHLRPRLKRLSDDVTEAWVQRALAEFASGSGAAPNQL